MQTLPDVTCARCGAPLPIDPVRSTVECSHCHAVQPIAAELRERAARHLASMRGAWADALEARRTELMHRRAAKATPSFMRWMIPFTLSVPFWIIASGMLGAYPIVLAVLLFVTLAMWWRFISVFIGIFRAPSVGLVLGSGLGACRACGAPVAVPEGDVRTSCPHCGATLLPTPEIKRALLEGALARVRAIGIEERIAEADNWRVAGDARAIFGVRGETSTVATVILVAGALALTALVVVLPALGGDAGAKVEPAHWACTVLSLAALLLIGRFVLAVRRARHAVFEFEKLIGRPLRSRR